MIKLMFRLFVIIFNEKLWGYWIKILCIMQLEHETDSKYIDFMFTFPWNISWTMAHDSIHIFKEFSF